MLLIKRNIILFTKPPRVLICLFQQDMLVLSYWTWENCTDFFSLFLLVLKHFPGKFLSFFEQRRRVQNTMLESYLVRLREYLVVCYVNMHSRV